MQQVEPDATSPLFSVIIPFEYHRGQWERSLLGWQSQTIDKAAYEIVLVVPPDFPAREQLHELAGHTTRIVHAGIAHDIGLCAVGAQSARGRYLFFTEAHCWPEPDVLDLCLRAFADRPEWAGLSCRSLPICHNRLSEAEADMYQADIEFGMNEHPWRKVLDQCFVTRRESDEACGGFRAELGHFAEWVLAADYYARGFTIGYLNEARFHHYYIGEVGELRTFTLDFVHGEIRYFRDGASGPVGEILEMPREWSCQDNLDAGMARGIVRAVAASFLADMRRSRWRSSVAAIWHWLPTAILGDGPARARGAVAVMVTRLALSATVLAGSRDGTARSLRAHIAALIRYQRLRCIRSLRTETPGVAVVRWGADIVGQGGFHPLERWNERRFRWSETAAAVRIEGRPGPNRIRIECLAVREPLHQIGLRWFLGGRSIADEAIAYGADSIELQIELPASGIGTLGWVCRPFAAAADARSLGLPVTSIAVTG